MRFTAFFVIGFFLSIVPRAEAQQSTGPIPAFSSGPYVQIIADLHKYYMESPQAGGTLAERMNERNRLVRQIISRIPRERRPLYENHRIRQERYLECKNSGGGSKRCPNSLEWPPGYQVIDASVGSTQRHFKAGPTVRDGRFLDATLGREGKGKNTGTYWGTGRLTAQEVQARVDQDLSGLRSILTSRGLPTDESIDFPIDRMRENSEADEEDLDAEDEDEDEDEDPESAGGIHG